jgi:uncharacterized membrane protein HdeD (DUF308 family)
MENGAGAALAMGLTTVALGLISIFIAPLLGTLQSALAAHVPNYKPPSPNLPAVVTVVTLIGVVLIIAGSAFIAWALIERVVKVIEV